MVDESMRVTVSACRRIYGTVVGGTATAVEAKDDLASCGRCQSLAGHAKNSAASQGSEEGRSILAAKPSSHPRFPLCKEAASFWCWPCCTQSPRPHLREPRSEASRAKSLPEARRAQFAALAAAVDLGIIGSYGSDAEGHGMARVQWDLVGSSLAPNASVAQW